MKTTQGFKVGDIVRFKLEDEHQEYATRWDFPTFGLKISKIEFIEDKDCLLIYFEGRENFKAAAVYDHRLEKQPNMFAFGKKNPKVKKLFLQYMEKPSSTGLCSWTARYDQKVHDFLRSQDVFKKEDAYPVEYFVLRSMKKSTSEMVRRYDKQYANRSYNSPDTPEGRLRIWWATNLAIAASQGKI